MRNAKPVVFAAISQSSEMEIEGSIHELVTRASDALRHRRTSQVQLSGRGSLNFHVPFEDFITGAIEPHNVLPAVSERANRTLDQDQKCLPVAGQNC